MFRAAQDSRIARLTEERDEVTELLCGVMGWLEKHNSGVYKLFIGPRIAHKQWWEQHKKLDAARLASEKLDDEERRALVEYVKRHGKAP